VRLEGAAAREINEAPTLIDSLAGVGLFPADTHLIQPRLMQRLHQDLRDLNVEIIAEHRSPPHGHEPGQGRSAQNLQR